MQGGRSSVCCWQAHMSVHAGPDLRHLHVCVLHWLLHAHKIISRQILEIGLNDMSLGCSHESPCFHPMSRGEGSSGTAQWAFLEPIV